MKSDRNVVPLPRTALTRHPDEMAFLPAALEIVETPPSPIGRTISVVIIAIFCVAVVWASLGQIDIVATAQGKVVPSGRTKVIQPFEIGVIRAIHVRDGQAVKEGDVLIELDPTINQAEREHLQSDLTAAQLDVARLRAALAAGADPVADFHPPEGASPAQVSTQRQFLIDQVAEHRSKLTSLDDQKRQKEAEFSTIQETTKKLEAIIPIVQERVDMRKSLADRELVSKIVYLENLQMLVENQRELAVQKSRLGEAQAAIAAITSTRAASASEFRRTLYGELAEAERKAAGLAHDIDKINERTKLQVLTAPVDGVVQQLAVHTIGGVVTPAQSLMVVVPSEGNIEVEAMLSNRDIGFIHEGQDVEIKVDTFNFTRYGLLHGKVLSISRDAIVRENLRDKNADRSAGTTAASSEPPGQELLYSARISLDRTRMKVDENFVDLAPGMAITAEIKTGTRRVISYLFSPLLRYVHEGLRER